MRRVLAGLGIAALAALSLMTGPSAGATPSTDKATDTVGPAAFGQPVINEVATRGPGSDQGAVFDQFVEIANPSQTNFADISNYQIRLYGCNNQLLQTVIVPQGTVLQPLGVGPLEQSYWVVSSIGYTGGVTNQPNAITVDVPDCGGVALFNPGGASRIDGVAFSSSVTAALEGTPLIPQTSTLDVLAPAYGRDIMSRDMNNNSLDFKLLVRSPGLPN